MTAVDLRSPSTDAEWRQAEALIEELIEWDVCQSQGMGFDRAEIVATFYPDALEDIRRRSADSGARLLLAVEGEGVAGCAAVRHLDAETCELYNVYVRPAYRGRGIASILVGELQRGALAAGYAVMCLETATFMHDAHELYRSHQFEVREHYRMIPERYSTVTISMQCSLRTSDVLEKPNKSLEQSG